MPMGSANAVHTLRKIYQRCRTGAWHRLCINTSHSEIRQIHGSTY